MSQPPPPDLNALRDFLCAGESDPTPADPAPSVNREGKVDTHGTPGADRSEIPRGVWA